MLFSHLLWLSTLLWFLLPSMLVEAAMVLMVVEVLNDRVLYLMIVIISVVIIVVVPVTLGLSVGTFMVIFRNHFLSSPTGLLYWRLW